jgi:hypothetical protein
MKERRGVSQEVKELIFTYWLAWRDLGAVFAALGPG